MIGLIVAIIATVVLLVGREESAGPFRPDRSVPERARNTPVVAAPQLPLVERLQAPPPQEPAAVVNAPAPGAEELLALSRGIKDLLALAKRVESTDPQRARQLLKQVLELNPTDETALDSLSKKMFIDEDHAGAKALLDRCMAAHPNSAGCKALAAQMPDPASREAALNKARQCLEVTPDNPECMAVIADGAFLEKNKTAAALFAVRMYSSAPNSPSTTLNVGRVKAMEGTYREARDLFEKACRQGSTAACFRADLLRSEGW